MVSSHFISFLVLLSKCLDSAKQTKSRIYIFFQEEEDTATQINVAGARRSSDQRDIRQVFYPAPAFSKLTILLLYKTRYLGI